MGGREWSLMGRGGETGRRGNIAGVKDGRQQVKNFSGAKFNQWNGGE